MHAVGLDLAGLGDFLDDLDRRHLVHFHDDGGFTMDIAIAQFLVQLFDGLLHPILDLGRHGAGGARAQSVKGALAFSVRQAPAGILASQTGEHRVGAVDVDQGRPAFEGCVLGQADLAQSAHADFGNQPPGFQPADGLNAGIDHRAVVGQAVDLEPQAVGMGNHVFDDGQRIGVDADMGLHESRLQ